MALAGRPSRRNATMALAQGAAAVPRKNFGGSVGTGNLRLLIKMLDARLPKTLGLPRAVGSYTVIRTTKLHRSDAAFVMFAPFHNLNEGNFYNWCGVEDVDATLAVNATSNARAINIPLAELAGATEVVPAALTVQVMNPASLQTASGVFAMGRVTTPFNYGGSTDKWNDLRARFISFFSPRLLTGGKLALRGVKCDAYPLDMSEYANFQPVSEYTGVFTWSNDAVRACALSPIVFVQSNAFPQVIEFLVTIEWRVRFDPGNPAVASHTYHNTTSDALWNGVCRAMSAAGHGVTEIAEDVLEAGALAAGAGRALAML